MATPRSAGGRLHARVGAAAFLLIAALIGASVLLVAGPAGADVNTVTGSAFGISGLSGPPSAPLPGGVSGTASDPAAGFGPLVASVHLIESGRVKVVLGTEEGEELLLRVLGAGEIFGELALFDQRPRSATVVTLEPTVTHIGYRTPVYPVRHDA